MMAMISKCDCGRMLLCCLILLVFAILPSGSWAEKTVREIPYAADNALLYIRCQDAAVKAPRAREKGAFVKKTDIFRIRMAKNEYESFQVILTPKGNEGETLKEVLLKAPGIKKGETVTIQGEIRQVGFINEKHPDALFPPGSWSDIVPGENFHLRVTFRTTVDAPAGIYRGELRLVFQKSAPVDLPFEVEVWDFTLSKETHVQPVLGGYINTDDIVNHYRLPYWSPAFEKFMAGEVFEKLAAYRMVPEVPAPIREDRWGKAPEWVTGRFGKALGFDGDRMYYEVPSSSRWGLPHNGFDPGAAFTVEAWIHCERPGRKQTILSHGPAWGGGYDWTLDSSGRLVMTLGQGYEPTQENNKRNRLYHVAARNALDSGWHHIAAVFDKGSLKIFIDGMAEADTTLPFKEMKSSFRPLFIGADLYGERRPFKGIIDEIRIYNRALSKDEIGKDMNSSRALHGTAAELSFETYPEYVPRFNSMFDAEGVEYFSRWARYWVDRGYGFSLPRCKELGDLERFWAAYYPVLVKEGWLDKASIKLPNDEATAGKRGEYNVQWAKKTKMLAPLIKISHTTGGRTVTDESLADFKAFVGLVDIWIANIFKKYLTHPGTRDFFDSERAAGRAVNFYFKWTTLAGDYLDTRYAFWLMMKYGFGPSLYRANFWTRPFMPTRPEKWTKAVPKGFLTSRSSGAGPGYGIYFWPGEKGLIPSVRAEMYRDGVEDYEYFHRLKELRTELQRLPRNARSETLLKGADDALEIPAAIWQSVNKNMMPESPDPSLLNRHRERFAAQIVMMEKYIANPH